MANIEFEGLFDIQEVLDQLQIGYATLYRWIKKAGISPVKIAGRNYLTQSDIERLKSERASQNVGETQGIGASHSS